MRTNTLTHRALAAKSSCRSNVARRTKLCYPSPIVAKVCPKTWTWHAPEGWACWWHDPTRAGSAPNSKSIACRRAFGFTCYYVPTSRSSTQSAASRIARRALARAKTEDVRHLLPFDSHTPYLWRERVGYSRCWECSGDEAPCSDRERAWCVSAVAADGAHASQRRFG